MSGRCAHWIGAERRVCGAGEGVRRFLTGLCCPAHTPSALAGRPEPQPGPGLPHGPRIPAPLSASALIDDRAIASGKRRASPEAYRAAQAAVSKTSQ